MTEFKTVLEIGPSQLSQTTTNWYVSKSKCPKWLRFTVNILSQITSMIITPIAMICDLIAGVIFKLLSLCYKKKRNSLSEKGCEFLKSGSAGGWIQIALCFLRIFKPSYSADYPPEPALA